jgi:ATP-dependent DNA helicase
VTHCFVIVVKMSDKSTPDEDSRAPTTAPSSPPDLAPMEKGDAGLGDDEIRKLKEEDRKARADNKRDELKRQKIRRKKAQQESAADREAKAKQLESLLAKSAVCSTSYYICC